MAEAVTMGEALQDPVLGKLTWDESMDWWVGELELYPGRRIEVFIDFNEEEDSQAEVFSRARCGLTRFREREPEYRRWTAAELLEGRWNKVELMTVSDITELLQVASILFLQDGRARVYWDDEDVLFFGHNVTTELDPNGECIVSGME
jgi:hypothetical protein